MDWIIIIPTAAVFGFCWWGLSKLSAPVFVVASVSLLAALIVWQSRSLLGIPL